MLLRANSARDKQRWTGAGLMLGGNYLKELEALVKEGHTKRFITT